MGKKIKISLNQFLLLSLVAKIIQEEVEKDPELLKSLETAKNEDF